MKFVIVLSWAIGLSACLFSALSATIINVPGDQPTIQAGINAANSGDTVLVADGIYSGSGNIGITFGGKELLLKTANGPENTIIDGGSNSLAFNITAGHGTDLIIDGFNIQNCFYNGGGGAIRSFGSSPVIRNCVFRWNHGIHGGVMYFNGNDSKSVCVPMVSYCTFVDNTGTGVAGVIYIQYNDISLTVENCILYNNIANVNVEPIRVGSESSLNINCTDIFNNSGGDWIESIAGFNNVNGNISEDPLFCDYTNGDYHIDYSSPCYFSNNDCNELIGALNVNCDILRTIWYVSTTGSDETGNGSQEFPFATIQKGIDMANIGDTVLVADGTYTGDGNRDIDFLGKSIVVLSENGSQHTIISCGGLQEVNHRGFIINSGENATIIGITIQDGYIVFSGGGGGIYCENSTLTLSGCEFNGNYTEGNGGAMNCVGSEINISDCLFIDNSTFIISKAGGIYCNNSSLDIINSNIKSNKGTIGGGLRIEYSDLTLVDCIVDNNSGPGGVGGGGCLVKDRI